LSPLLKARVRVTGVLTYIVPTRISRDTLRIIRRTFLYQFTETMQTTAHRGIYAERVGAGRFGSLSKLKRQLRDGLINSTFMIIAPDSRCLKSSNCLFSEMSPRSHTGHQRQNRRQPQSQGALYRVNHLDYYIGGQLYTSGRLDRIAAYRPPSHQYHQPSRRAQFFLRLRF
jgi:hypothetical protein